MIDGINSIALEPALPARGTRVAVSEVERPILLRSGPDKVEYTMSSIRYGFLRQEKISEGSYLLCIRCGTET